MFIFIRVVLIKKYYTLAAIGREKCSFKKEKR
jgi:hypothetical protein